MVLDSNAFYDDISTGIDLGCGYSHDESSSYS
ncbi:hypothetical protein Anacy_4666 [Anabaena cylindrica PCC 7122]|uniref:Uncharacterized protein n=1 Tax=Anabaena cylindrica (strain ATCC 27899 / PCC 7122) TaxID=272123 RepID=K9ZNV6_ANACC|nr:hypothetical protein Anacy_4666 [Anabaena cylindrica PCC 7122]BAY02923.1 hypothetical protein NIES19_21730 [Anabaena cylindrica PCC 7122]